MCLGLGVVVVFVYMCMFCRSVMCRHVLFCYCTCVLVLFCVAVGFCVMSMCLCRSCVVVLFRVVSCCDVLFGVYHVMF